MGDRSAAAHDRLSAIATRYFDAPMGRTHASQACILVHRRTFACTSLHVCRQKAMIFEIFQNCHSISNIQIPLHPPRSTNHRRPLSQPTRVHISQPLPAFIHKFAQRDDLGRSRQLYMMPSHWGSSCRAVPARRMSLTSSCVVTSCFTTIAYITTMTHSPWSCELPIRPHTSTVPPPSSSSPSRARTPSLPSAPSSASTPLPYSRHPFPPTPPC